MKKRAQHVLKIREWADIIDALLLSALELDMQIESHLPPQRKNWNEADKENFLDWNGRRKRYRELRALLVKWEKESKHSLYLEPIP
jgi:hypothetical protein